MPIRILPEDVANKIAAGEVVERPASAVKELIENALDAEADAVRVELTEGGKRRIIVRDNGCGMAPEDAVLAVRRHATSKLAAAKDLERISTLGFRGEALPSIASVSKFELLTRPAGAMEGTRVVVEGGKQLEASPVGCAPGTRVSVSNLFYNVPARLKFLKTDKTELNRSSAHLQWAALSRPDVRFTLLHNGRELIDAPQCAERIERIQTLYGKQFVERLIPFTKTFDRFEIECYIGDPNLTKPNRAHQLFFLNGRPIRDKTVSAAVGRALQETTPKGRYPVAFLFMTLPPSEVDVNVHPAKSEARFKEERALFRNIVQAIAQGIGSRAYIPVVDTSASSESSAPSGGFSRTGRRSDQESAFRSGGGFSRPSRSVYRSANRRAEPVFEAAAAFENSADNEQVELLGMPEIELVGVLYNTYILAADERNMYMIDQHVASERVHYERIMTQMQTGKAQSQGLLKPVVAELSASQASAFEGSQEWLAQFGIEAEAFGGRAVSIQAIPSMLDPSQAAQMCRDLLDALDEEIQPERSWEALQEKAAATVACHSAVRAGDALPEEAVKQLLKDLSACKLPFNCPHGRPVVIQMPRSEIETRFQRR
ncbi:MAG: DNA mismatch repair endonuclease MutL [Candidatus Poribacteria bacterium]|nr:DNA mismatch repair endonuclease MutL [Candidatus Poribacteria bacterium]